MLGYIALAALTASLVLADSYTWKNVHTGGGGGWIGNVVFNPSQKGLAYLRTDIGGAYKLAADGVSWTPLLDFADNAHWNYWGVESIATDPVDPKNVYIEVGLYTNSWDPNNGTILKSLDQGASFTSIPLPFKVGGNMPGRGAGERLVIDPNNNKVLYLGARSGNGLWRSTDAGLTWSRVTSLTSTGTYAEQPSDSSGYNSDPLGVGWIVFDTTGPKTAAGSSRIFVAVETAGAANIFVSQDAGTTWAAVPGQQTTFMSHKGVLAPAEKSLYVSYVNQAGPFDGNLGSLAKYNITSGNWTDITPAQAKTDGTYGFGGLSIDAQKPGVVMAASLNQYYPDAQIWRSLDGGSNWSNLYNFSYPPPDYQLAVTRDYTWDISTAPWIQSFTTDSKQIGWGIEGLAIDPFDSNHFLYGTGLTLYGSRNLLKWDTTHNITLGCLSNGIEETAVLGLVSPPQGAHLVTAVGDVGGWVHDNLDVAPPTLHVPVWGTVADVDYAGAAPLSLVRVGNTAGQVATSTDGGHTWTALTVGAGLAGGHVTYTANASAIVWSPSSSGTYMSFNGSAFMQSKGLPAGAIVEADKLNDTVVYGSANGQVYVSTDYGMTFAYVNTLGSSKESRAIATTTLAQAGEFWVSTDRGIWHLTNYGKSVVGLSGGLSQAYSIAVGAPAPGSSTLALYAAGVVNGVYGLWRSDNGGTSSYTQLDNAKNRLGLVSGMLLAADPRIYKRVYVGTNGRGVFYGN